MEQDFAYRLCVTKHCLVSNNFVDQYLYFKQVVTYDLYPSTRVITEIYVEQPRLPELQQMTFSSYYKNDTTYIGVSPSGAITFVISRVNIR